MAIAATISVPLTSPTCRTLASLSNLSRRSTLPTPQRTFKYPNLRLVASSMSTETAVKTSSASFLHRKEFGFLHFAKYHGLGNDFILIDNRDSSEPRISAGKAVQLCDRNFGVGADGVIFVLPGINGTDYTMRIFNSDGSEPEMNHPQSSEARHDDDSALSDFLASLMDYTPTIPDELVEHYLAKSGFQCPDVRLLLHPISK